MEKPYFVWQADLEDTSTISQFVSDKETLFSEVEKNMDAVIKFQISAENGEYYAANLLTGEIDCNHKLIEKIELPKGKKAKLIYKRRNQVRTDISTGEMMSSRMTFFLGLRSDKDEKIITIFPGLGQLGRSVKLRNKEIETDITDKTGNSI